jgi:Coenzyme PQQ synthesis protein D (PqqD)
METKIDLNGVYLVSKDVVARDIHGEFIIVPISSGIGESDGEIFSLNRFGKAIWDKLDGKRSLKEVVHSLTSQFEGRAAEIEIDVLGLSEELLKRKMIVKG